MRCCKTISSSASRRCPPGEDPDSMVRREGKEEFEKRVANARDFFDYWIEREAASTDLDSLGREDAARAQARGDGVAGARSAHARRGGEQSVERAARCAACGFRITSAQSVLACAGVPVRLERQLKLVPRPVRHMMSRCFACWPCAMQRRANFLHAQNWREVLAQTAGRRDSWSAFSRANLRPDDPASINAFMATPFDGRGSAGFVLAAAKDAAHAAEQWSRNGGSGLSASVVRRQLQIAERPDENPAVERG